MKKEEFQSGAMVTKDSRIDCFGAPKRRMIRSADFLVALPLAVSSVLAFTS